MLTKPAAVFVQLIGATVVIYGAYTAIYTESSGIIAIVIGSALLLAGGSSIRKRMAQDATSSDDASKSSP